MCLWMLVFTEIVSVVDKFFAIKISTKKTKVKILILWFASMTDKKILYTFVCVLFFDKKLLELFVTLKEIEFFKCSVLRSTYINIWKRIEMRNKMQIYHSIWLIKIVLATSIVAKLLLLCNVFFCIQWFQIVVEMGRKIL